MPSTSKTTVRSVSSTSSSNVLYVQADYRSVTTYHPQFADMTADIVLRSSQSTLYRVHSYTLRTTSGFFETMFSLPQPSIGSTGILGHTGKSSKISAPVLDVYEDDAPLECILRLICGLSIPQWHSIEDLERVLTIAEKWDTPGPISVLRQALSSSPFLHTHPLKCYLIAMHFGWKAEAQLASTHTLTLNLYDPVHSSLIGRMSSKTFFPLLDLHRRRRDMFRQLLNSPERFIAGNSIPYHCNKCGVTELDNYAWKAYKHAMFMEMERRPLGDTLGLSSGESAEWPEALACWNAKCTKEGCGGLNYDRVATLKQIRICVSLLPSAIDMK